MAKAGMRRPDISASEAKIKQAKKKNETPDTQNCKNCKDGSTKDCK
ncbi:MAG: hypothetical protein ACOX66_01640 [Oscillospiraceae bacterium]|jgi:hypothetical protein